VNLFVNWLFLSSKLVIHFMCNLQQEGKELRKVSSITEIVEIVLGAK
jgi:hypothetical protein